MKKIFFYVLIIILIISILFLAYKLLKLQKNHTIITAIDSANRAYTDSAMNNFHIRVETKTSSPFEENKEQTNTIKEIYRKGLVVKSITTENENTFVHYQNFDTNESYFFNFQDNTKIGYGKSVINEFLKFLELYYANMPKVEISDTDEYYIVNFPTSIYYFNRENYRIEKIEVFSDIKIWSETTYTYFDNEEITDEMVSMPEI